MWVGEQASSIKDKIELGRANCLTLIIRSLMPTIKRS
jgi:hypothetical protein